MQAAGTVRIGVLGEMTISLDGDLVAPPAPRARAVLARLVLDVGRPVSVDALLDDVWGSNLPAGRAKAVAYQIKELRNILEPDRTGSGTTIATSNSGYTLTLDSSDVDLYRFEHLIEDARAASDDPAKSEVLADDALRVWRGRPFADIGGSEAIDNEIDRLDRLHLLARRTRLEARLAQGLAADVVPDLTALAREHPLDEAVIASLMQALATAGRTSDALRAFGEYRRRLGTELGIEPSRELTSLESSMLGAPVAVDEANRPPLSIRASLPAETTPLIGRADAVRDVIGLTRDRRVVTLTGIGGVGKTRLAQRVAGAVEDEFADGAVFVPLATIDRAELVLDKFAESLDVRAGEGRLVADVVASYVSSRDLLLVIDNCEHVVAGVADVVADLTARAPEVTVLATSREPLGVPGEHVYRVATLDDDDAVGLFVERARAARIELQLDGDALDDVRRICARVEGLPLAIELAAARTRSMSPREIADRLAGSIDVLNRGRRTVRPRQQTMHNAIDWSFDLLEDHERELLAELSVFVNGFDHEAAAAVGRAVKPNDLDDVLDRLVEKSLLDVSTDRAGRTRHRMLEPIRQFARAALQQAGDEHSAAQRHATYVLAVTAEAEPYLRGPDQLAWGARLDVLRDDVRATLPVLLAAGRVDDHLDVCWNLMWYWLRDGLHREAVETIEAALNAVEDGAGADAFRVARGCLEAAVLAADITMDEQAVALAERGIAVAERLEDQGLLGILTIARGRMLRDVPGRTDGYDDLERGEQLLTDLELWNRRWDAALLDLWRGMGRHEDGVEGRRAHFARAIEGFRAEGDFSLVGGAQILSTYLAGEGVDDWIASNLEAAVASAKRSGYRHQLAHAQMFAALLAARSGIGEPSVERLDEAAEILDSMGDRPCWISCRTAAAAARLAAADLDEARHALVPAARSLIWEPSPPRQINVLITAAGISLASDAKDLCARLLGRLDALSDGQPFGQPHMDERVDVLRAALDTDLGVERTSILIGSARKASDADALEAFVNWAEAVVA